MKAALRGWQEKGAATAQFISIKRIEWTKKPAIPNKWVEVLIRPYMNN